MTGYCWGSACSALLKIQIQARSFSTISNFVQSGSVFPHLAVSEEVGYDPVVLSGSSSCFRGVLGFMYSAIFFFLQQLLLSFFLSVFSVVHTE